MIQRSTILILIFLFVATTATTRAQTNLCSIADWALKEASTISGLKKKRKVPCQVQTKDQVKDYMLTTLDEKVTPAKIVNEEIIYKALGLIPDSFKYKEGLVEMYLGQIAGYYDPDKDHFVMAGWMPALMQSTIAVHEQMHALQDQYFHLEKFADMEILPSDILIARSALMEGEAVAVQTDYGRKLLGQKLLVDSPDVQALLLQSLLGVSFVTTMKDAPGSLVAMMIFPYTSGLRFAHALLRKGGYKMLNKAFERPPRSTEEILHPEKYFVDQADFIEISEDEALASCGFERESEVYSDVFGEFSISALLSMYQIPGADAAKVASGWGGDRVVLVKTEKGESNVVWKLHWDTKEDAKSFIDTFSEALSKKYKRAIPTEKWISLGSEKVMKLNLEGLDSAVCIKLKNPGMS